MRRALVQHQFLYLRLDFRDKLDRRGAGADHGNALASKRVGMIPLRGMEQLSGEFLQAWNIRYLRFMQVAGTGNDGPRMILGLVGAHDPATQALIPVAVLCRLTVMNVLLDMEARGHLIDVIENFRLAGKHARPVRLLRKGKRIQRRRYITGAPGIGIVTPGASQ